MSNFYDEVPEPYGPVEAKQPQSQLEARVEALEQRLEGVEKWLRFTRHSGYDPLKRDFGA